MFKSTDGLSPKTSPGHGHTADAFHTKAHLVVVTVQCLPPLKNTRVKSIRELRAANSACPATLKAVCFPLQIRALCSLELMFRFATGRS